MVSRITPDLLDPFFSSLLHPPHSPVQSASHVQSEFSDWRDDSGWILSYTYNKSSLQPILRSSHVLIFSIHLMLKPWSFLPRDSASLNQATDLTCPKVCMDHFFFLLSSTTHRIPPPAPTIHLSLSTEHLSLWLLEPPLFYRAPTTCVSFPLHPLEPIETPSCVVHFVTLSPLLHRLKRFYQNLAEVLQMAWFQYNSGPMDDTLDFSNFLIW